MAGDPGSGGTARLKTHALFAAGCVLVALGAIGVFVPVLPTTPFLLLAAACFLRSSPRVHDWLVNSRFLGSYIRQYRSGAGLPLRARVGAIALLWLTIGFSVAFVVQSLAVRIILLLIAAGVTLHIASIRPRTP
jgi:uncharacterized membrane protein YbaN (DUF454 family)